MSQTYPSIAGTSQVKDSRTSLLSRDEALRSAFSGASAPASPAPVAGQKWFKDADLRTRTFDGANWRRDMLALDGALTIATVTALVADDAAAKYDDGQHALVLGTATAGDAEAFLVKWNASSSATHDGVNTFRPSTGAAAVGAGRWLRVASALARTFANADSTPSVANAQVFTGAAAGGTLTDFDDGYEFQRIVIFRGAADVTITHAAGVIELASGASKTLTVEDNVIELIHLAGVWRQIGGGASGARRLTPLGGARWITQCEPQKHYWTIALWYDDATGYFWRAYTSGFRHEQSIGAPIMVGYSKDGMLSWRDREVWSNKLRDARFGVGCIGAAGRWAIIFASYAANDTDYKLYCLRTDDKFGTAPTVTDITSVVAAAPLLPYDAIHRYPAAAGGHDTNGYILYGYGGATPEIRWLATTDNFVNFTTGTACAMTTGGVVEGSMASPAAGEYVLAMRQAVAGSPASKPVMFAVSNDMKTFSSTAGAGKPVASNIPCGNNPVKLIAEGGRLHLDIATREGYPIIGGPNQMIHAELDGRAVYAANGLVSTASWSIAGHFPSDFTGYFVHTVVSGRYYALGLAGETLVDAVPSGGSNSSNSGGGIMIAFGPDQPTLPSEWAILQARPRKNLLGNPTFVNTHRVLPATVADGPLTEAWHWEGSGATVTPTIIDLDPDLQRVAPYAGEKVLQLNSTGDPDDFSLVRHRWYGPDEVAPLADQHVCFQLEFEGVAPLSLVGQVYFVWDGSTPEAVNASISWLPVGNGVTRLVGVVATPTRKGKTIGANATMDLRFNGVANAAWNARLLGAKLEIGKEPTPIEAPDLDADRVTRLNRHCQRKSFPAFSSICSSQAIDTTKHEGTISFAPGLAGGTRTASLVGAASDLQVNDYERGGATGTAASFPDIGGDNVLLRVTQATFTNFTLGMVGYLRSIGSGCSVIRDCGV